MKIEKKERSFNVLCETHRSSDDVCVNFHVPPESGQALLVEETVSDCGLEFVRSYVKYNGYVYQVDYVRTGLAGMAVTLGLKQRPNGAVLELYTDTPVPDSNRSQEEIQTCARLTMEHKQRLRGW